MYVCGTILDFYISDAGMLKGVTLKVSRGTLGVLLRFQPLLTLL